MKALTKEQIEYVELKLMFDRMRNVYIKMSKANELSCANWVPDNYPKTNNIVEYTFYALLEQSKQDRIEFLASKTPIK